MKSNIIPLINHSPISLEREERKENLLMNNLLKLNLRKLKKEIKGKNQIQFDNGYNNLIIQKL